MGDLTRNKTLPDSSDKADFHALIDGDDGATIGDGKVTTAKINDLAVTTAKIANDNVTFAKLDDDGDYGPFTGDWSFNEIALVEDTAPSTAAGEGKLYTKDTSGQPELFFREESDGDEVQITSGGEVGSTTSTSDFVIKAWGSVTYAGGTPTLNDSYNVTSITDTGTGDLLITWDTDFADTNYSMNVVTTGALAVIARAGTKSTGTCQVVCLAYDGNPADPSGVDFMAIGAQ